MNDMHNDPKSECPACNMYSIKYDKFCDAHRLLRGTTLAEIKRLAIAQAAGSEPQS